MLKWMKAHGWLLTGIIGLLVILQISGCSSRGGGSGQKKVVATTGMIGDLVRNVGGGAVDLHELMGAGVDPHLYQPTAEDTTRLSQADLIFYNGLHLEGKMVELLEKNSRARAVTANMPKEKLLKEEDSGQPDPHVWFDVSLWLHALDTVEKELTVLVPEKAAVFHKNAAAYRAELEDLHEEVKQKLASVPKPQRVMVTAHDAFGYFGKAYDIEVEALQGVSTANEAGLKEVERVVSVVSDKKLKAIFPETSVPEDGINAVIERCKARGHEVKKADGHLYSDAMGEAGTYRGTYPGMVRYNTRLIVRSLK